MLSEMDPKGQILHDDIYEVPRAATATETESRLVVARDWRGGRMGVYCLTGAAPVPQNETSLEVDGADGCTTAQMRSSPLCP